MEAVLRYFNCPRGQLLSTFGLMFGDQCGEVVRAVTADWQSDQVEVEYIYIIIYHSTTMSKNQPSVTLYTDGAAEPNPGRGGYGVVLISGNLRKELSAGYEWTTNNRMELLAVIAGLEALKQPCHVTVYSDSRYVVDAVSKGSVFKWQAKRWMRTQTGRAKNSDLWERFLHSYEKHSVTLKWVPGHCGIAENERCDQLAVEALKSETRIPDTGYQPDRSDPIPPKEPGDLCLKCGVALIKKTPKRKKRKAGQKYYFEWYLYCTGCEERYMIESAKRQYAADSYMMDLD
jgi:ribonuclease HI